MLTALEHPNYTLVDLLRQSARGGQGTHNPVTFGEAKKIESGYYLEEPYLTPNYPKLVNLSLDYIFEVKFEGHRPDYTPDVDETRVEKFEVGGFVFRHLSDHYGVSTTLLLN